MIVLTWCKKIHSRVFGTALRTKKWRVIVVWPWHHLYHRFTVSVLDLNGYIQALTLPWCSPVHQNQRCYLFCCRHEAATRCAATGVWYSPKILPCTNFLWSNNDVRTIIKLIPQWVLKFYTPPPKKKNFYRPTPLSATSWGVMPIQGGPKK